MRAMMRMAAARRRRKAGLKWMGGSGGRWGCWLGRRMGYETRERGSQVWPLAWRKWSVGMSWPVAR